MPIHIVAESGSSKTDWCITDTVNGTETFIQSPGINPHFSDREDVLNLLNSHFSTLSKSDVTHIFFYGPGTAQETMRQRLRDWLGDFFTHAVIEIDTDLTAAGRATLGSEKGLACILGTGSNSGIYENGIITLSFPSLGYIFGDEGSGASIGKQLVSDFLNDAMPPEVKELFVNTYRLTHTEIIRNVYGKPFPNRYLAAFTRFVYDHRDITYCRSLVDSAFDSFFTKRVFKFEGVDALRITFCGSVAYAFSDILVKVASRHGLSINAAEDIVQAPVRGLVGYHRGK